MTGMSVVVGWMAERSKAAVLKTVVGQLTGGSNPSPSVKIGAIALSRGFQRY